MYNGQEKKSNGQEKKSVKKFVDFKYILDISFCWLSYWQTLMMDNN